MTTTTPIRDKLAFDHVQRGDILTVHPHHRGGYALAWESADGRTRVGAYGECDQFATFPLERLARANAERLGWPAPVRRTY